MKTAIYIEDGVVQLVLTPESDFEKNAVKSFKDKETTTFITQGSFYKCRGGWDRHSNDSDDMSMIMRISKNEANIAEG